jgi:RimJ/RimL family protein N-acetyltransferase
MPRKKRTASMKAAAARAAARRRRDRERRRREKAPSKPFVRSTAPRAQPDAVEFLPMRSARVQGVRRIGWQLLHQGRRAGTVSILCYEENGQVVKGSIDVQLNAKSRGRGIGTIAFRRASELSGLPEVFACIRKNNIASRIAAERAGFKPTVDQPSAELNMVWRRPKP